jgi:hypothetical protein
MLTPDHKARTEMNRYSVNLEIHAKTHQGQTCYQVGKRGALLVQRPHPGEPWKLVSKLEGELTHTDLIRSYGCWTDREVATGSFFWKKVLRPKDGEIQPDEVVSFAVRVAYSWESHAHRDTSDLPYIEQLALNLNPAGKGPVGTLREVWQS